MSNHITTKTGAKTQKFYHNRYNFSTVTYWSAMMGAVSVDATSRLERVRTDINALLERYYDERIARAFELHIDYAVLWQAMKDLSVQNGKRLRPYILVATYEGLGGTDYKAVLPIAAGVEILHASTLMHDDIIDRDYVRYGMPNIAGQYRQRYGDAADGEHYANAAALLAGDLALSGAYELLMQSTLPADTKIAAQAIMSRSIFEVVGGELLDSESVLSPFEAVDSLTIAHLKTASYSFVSPLVMAATLAGADKETEQALRLAGKSLGIAYQLADDIAGLFGDEKVTGKPNTSDLSEGKRTYLMQRTLARVRPADKALLEGLLGTNVGAKQAEVARQIVRDSGALEETRALLDRYVREAKQALATVPIQEDVRTELFALVERIIHV